MGINTAMLANIHAKKGHSFTPTDFMPKFQKEPERIMSGEDILAHFLKKPKGAR